MSREIVLSLDGRDWSLRKKTTGSLDKRFDDRRELIGNIKPQKVILKTNCLVSNTPGGGAMYDEVIIVINISNVSNMNITWFTVQFLYGMKYSLSPMLDQGPVVDECEHNAGTVYDTPKTAKVCCRNRNMLADRVYWGRAANLVRYRYRL